LPTVAEVAELHKSNHPFSWRVAESLLNRKFKKEGIPCSTNEPGPSASPELIRVLEKSISMLETELNAKNTQIAEFQERQRESNLLLKQANEQLGLLGDGRHQSSRHHAVPAEHSTDEEGIQQTQKSPSKKKRKSFWQMLNSPLR
jgi:hypothetical protein